MLKLDSNHADGKHFFPVRVDVAITVWEQDAKLCAALTPREREVISALAAGLLYKEVADKLEISFSTVHKHQHNIFSKLRVGNRTEAISKWHRFLEEQQRRA